MKHKTSNFLSIIAVTSTLVITNLPVTATETDDRIESAASKSYVFKTFLKNDSVKTEAKDGVVTLTGTVSESFHKSLAQDTVEGLPSVKSVNNQLIVESEEATKHSDKWLGQRVKTALQLHRNMNGRDIHVVAKDGEIALKGVASSEAQKELATEYAKDVEGVKDVKNEMTITEIKTDTDRTIAEKIDDASITAQIKASLITHWSTSALNTHIETREGVVTVSGIAANAAEKSLVSKLISDINGVISVSNNMTIR